MLLLILAACTPEDGACDTMAVASVQLQVADIDGQIVSGATATYSVDGGEAQPCDSLYDGTIVCGWEVEGDFVITVGAEGFASQELSATVEGGECHVVTEIVPVQLEPTICDDMAVAAMVVSPVDSVDGSAVAADVVRYKPADAAVEPTACETDDGGFTWICGWEETGTFDVEIEATGYLDHSVTGVVVESDGCHPITQNLAPELELAECTDEQRYALSVFPQDKGTGALVQATSVMWGLSFSDMAPQPCTPSDVEFGWDCGLGQSGALDLYVEAWGYNSFFQTEILVETDECGVSETVELHPQLEGMVCTEEATAALHVTITDSQGDKVESADVSWDLSGAAGPALKACDHLGSNEWACGWEVVGTLDLWVSASPYKDYSQTGIVVPGDFCGPETVEVPVVLEFLND